MAQPGLPSRFPELQDREWLVEQVASGKRGRDLAAEIGCSAPLLYQKVKKYGIQWPPRTPDELRDAEWLHQHYVVRMKGTTAISEELGCSDTSVQNALEQAGIPPRTQMEGRRVRSERIRRQIAMPEAADLYAAGKTLVYLGERYGVSEHVVREVLADAGIAIRTKAETWTMLKADPEQVARRKAAFAHRRRPTGIRKMKDLLEQDGVCAFCAKNKATERHHINAVRSDDRPENIAPLCFTCHAKIEWFIGKATNGLHLAFKNGSTEMELVNE